jgi:hypothetical protein
MKGSDGLGRVGKCLGPYEIGDDCSEGDGEDDQCVSKECGLNEAGSSKYVCCADEGMQTNHSFPLHIQILLSVTSIFRN